MTTTRDTNDVFSLEEFNTSGNGKIRVRSMTETTVASISPGVKSALDGESSGMIRAGTDLLDVERIENGDDDGIKNVVHHSDSESSAVSRSKRIDASSFCDNECVFTPAMDRFWLCSRQRFDECRFLSIL